MQGVRPLQPPSPPGLPGPHSPASEGSAHHSARASCHCPSGPRDAAGNETEDRPYLHEACIPVGKTGVKLWRDVEVPTGLPPKGEGALSVDEGRGAAECLALRAGGLRPRRRWELGAAQGMN